MRRKVPHKRGTAKAKATTCGKAKAHLRRSSKQEQHFSAENLKAHSAGQNRSGQRRTKLDTGRWKREGAAPTNAHRTARELDAELCTQQSALLSCGDCDADDVYIAAAALRSIERVQARERALESAQADIVAQTISADAAAEMATPIKRNTLQKRRYSAIVCLQERASAHKVADGGQIFARAGSCCRSLASAPTTAP